MLLCWFKHQFKMKKSIILFIVLLMTLLLSVLTDTKDTVDRKEKFSSVASR
ncbi:hypothetical protein MTsPCn5_19700 [Croceitalea sp. MTPC5]|nr:hypothetical protein MTsPCn5_19700 [Croceitalea sp. MTPC5]